MCVEGLRKYIISTPSTREKIKLREFAIAHREKTGKEPELLCDFVSVVSWVLSAWDYSLIESGKQSPYSLLYGNHLKRYGERLLSFVEAIQSLGLKLVFFVEGCPISELNEDILYEAYLADWRKSLSECATILQVCAGNCELSEVCWRLKEGIVGHMTSLLESTDGVNVIYCAGKLVKAAVSYLQSNKNACGILSSDTNYAIVPSCGLFLLDLFGLDVHHPVLPFKSDQDLTCEVVWSSWLASSLDLETHQLADLAILCGNDFSFLLNSKLRPWNTLGIANPSITTIAKWISSQTTALCSNNEMREFLSQNPSYELAIKQSYQVYLEKINEAASHSEKKNLHECLKEGSVMAKMASLVMHHFYLRPVLLEPETINQPRFCDATLHIRKFVYALTGLSRVTEVGIVSSTTAVVSRREPLHIPVELDWIRVEEDNENMLSFVSGLPKNVRIAILFHGVISPPCILEGRNEFNIFLSRCANDGQLDGTGDSCGAVILLASLIFMKSSNSRLNPSPSIFVCELEALLTTCLITLAGLPSWDYPDLPSPKAVTISSRFSHLIDQVYWLACCLGLSLYLPPQGELFSSCAYIPFYHACYLYEEDVGGGNLDHSCSTRPKQKRLLAIYKELWELAPVLELRAEILKETSTTLSRIVELYTKAIQAISSSKTLMNMANLETDKEANSDEDSEVTLKGSWCPVPCLGNVGESLLDTDDTILSTNDSLPSLGRSELSYSMECRVMEEDHYYSCQPLLEDCVNVEAGCDPVISDDDDEGEERCEGHVEGEEERGKGDRESGEKSEELMLKVTVDSILNMSSNNKGEGLPITIDSEGRKTVQVDSVLVNISDSAESTTEMKRSKQNRQPETRKKLPIMEHRSKILQLVHDHSVVCIEGETGCGKSTKVPQFILDEAMEQRKPTYCNIIITQPRRVAAVKLAERVAAERGERVGKTVGYCVGGSHHRAPHTKLTYCTMGYFLQVRSSY